MSRPSAARIKLPGYRSKLTLTSSDQRRQPQPALYFLRGFAPLCPALPRFALPWLVFPSQRSACESGLGDISPVHYVTQQTNPRRTTPTLFLQLVTATAPCHWETSIISPPLLLCQSENFKGPFSLVQAMQRLPVDLFLS